ncbi:alpha-aminoadipic semialdehyde synthase isoform X2 [Euphorbia lathyris]|uniref:alpha-aminoadipic semialdehyde synthase isoform X2 n=1 Tax=Euphorbia lathyris TaxID=212925 RepID=UPI003313E2C8
MLGNGVVGILAESCNKWERRVPLTPSHCARLLNRGRDGSGVARIIVQPSTKRIHHDAMYEDVGCEISEDLSECGLIVGVKQPKLEMILPDRAYAFFSHTHKAQKENMPLLDKILTERASLYDYELIVGDHGKRLLAFGKYAGRAGLVDFLHGLGQRYLSLGYSTPFLSLGSSYMYSSLAAAKAAVISVAEEIATLGLPSGICPLVFVFTGSGNVSQGAQEIFKLLPHTFVDPSRLPELFAQASESSPTSRTLKRVYQVYGCIVTSKDMVEPAEPSKTFDKADYYAHPEQYKPIFHEKIGPYASVIGTELLVSHFGRRYDPLNDSYHHDIEGNGVICSSVDILPTEFAKEASQHFGDILSQFIGGLASTTDITKLPSHLRRACIAHGGTLTPLFEYILRMRKSDSEDMPENSANSHSSKKKFNTLVSLSGHLFDKFLINEALDIIEAAGGSFHLVKCQVGQSADATSYSELEVGADDKEVLDQIVDSLTSLANPDENQGLLANDANKISLKVGKVLENGTKKDNDRTRTSVLIVGAGRVCRPAAEFLSSVGSIASCEWYKACLDTDFEEQKDVHIIVASLYLKDAEEIIDGISNAKAVQLDIMDNESLCNYISQVEVVISLLPPSCHIVIANACIKLQKHLVTASYVDDSMSALDEKAKAADITILGEMGLDPGIDHMMAMKMINEARARKGIIKSFTSYCGALPSPAAADNPLAYKFSWSPAGAIRAGRNPATYRSCGEIVHVEGDKLYDSASKLRIPQLPAFALECLPNRDSLVYGKVYGIEDASTIFRGTLRYEGFGKIMGTFARIGLFSTESHPLLGCEQRPTFRTFLNELLNFHVDGVDGSLLLGEKDIAEKIAKLGHCEDKETAIKAAKTIIILGLHDCTEIPATCKSAFDITCFRMEERLTYSSTEQDMVLLHHELEVEFPDNPPTEYHRGTLLEFGTTKNGKTITSMALTVGIPAAIGALLLLENKIKTRGVLRPILPEVYLPALSILQAQGIKLIEKID